MLRSQRICRDLIGSAMLSALTLTFSKYSQFYTVISWSFIDRRTSSLEEVVSNIKSLPTLTSQTSNRFAGWMCFFKSSWGQFGARFNCILDSIERHSKLVDQEANANLISETMAWRNEAKEAAIRLEEERLATQRLAALSWLGKLMSLSRYQL
jgi:hypothetical protein